MRTWLPHTDAHTWIYRVYVTGSLLVTGVRSVCRGHPLAVTGHFFTSPSPHIGTPTERKRKEKLPPT